MTDKPETTNLEFLEQLRTLVWNTDKELTKFLETASPEDVFEALVLLHAIKGDIGDTYGMFSASAGQMLSDKEVVTKNGTTVEKKVASDRRGWEHKKLAHEVVRRLNDMSVDMDTGEVITSADEIIERIFDYVQPSYWRIKELTKIGINADSYCEVGDIKTSIIVRKAK